MLMLMYDVHICIFYFKEILLTKSFNAPPIQSQNMAQINVLKLIDLSSIHIQH